MTLDLGPAATAPRPVAWPTLDKAALHGLAGRFVEIVSPTSEADPVGILLHFLVGAGNLIGPGPHARVEQDQHPARLFAVLVGPTGSGRKGTSGSAAKAVLRAADRTWRIAAGLSTGEGMIFHIRDRREGANPKTGEPEVEDEGVLDKRVLVLETEFASVLSRMTRDGNTLSAVLRAAWDHGDLSTLTRNSPLVATGGHVSIVAHITQLELNRLLATTEMCNGFANRFLWALVRRAQLLPDGRGLDPQPLAELGAVLAPIAAAAPGLGILRRDPEAAAMWRDIYAHLSRERDGFVGALLSRAEAQVLRLSVLYAVLDRSPWIRRVHLEAAVAVWTYCEQSAVYLFAGRLGHPVADAILEALARADELTRTQIGDLFSRHKDSIQLDEALGMIARSGLATRESRQSGGRPVEIWRRA